MQIIENRRTYDVCITSSGAGGGMAARAPLEMGFVGCTWKTKTAAERVTVITNGAPGTAMLPFEAKLSKAKIAALARYGHALDSPAARAKE